MLMNNIIELLRWSRLIERLRLKERNPWKRGNRNRTGMKAAPNRIRAHKRARWEMSKLSRRANRSK
jgi:hypothetical protein